MASMTSKERAQHYFQRLLKATNYKSELESILNDLNSLVFTNTTKPIDKETKIKILEELENLIRSSPSLDSISESYDYGTIRKSTSASDNSDILDVISAMKKKV